MTTKRDLRWHDLLVEQSGLAVAQAAKKDWNYAYLPYARGEPTERTAVKNILFNRTWTTSCCCIQVVYTGGRLSNSKELFNGEQQVDNTDGPKVNNRWTWQTLCTWATRTPEWRPGGWPSRAWQTSSLPLFAGKNIVKWLSRVPEWQPGRQSPSIVCF